MHKHFLPRYGREVFQELVELCLVFYHGSPHKILIFTASGL